LFLFRFSCESPRKLLAVNRWAAVGSPSGVKISQVCRLQDFVKERQRWKIRVNEKEMLFKVADAVVGGFSPLFLG